MSATVRVIMLFILSWQSFYRIADIAVSGLFQCISLMLWYLATVTRSDYLKHVAQLVPDIVP